ncbi:ABC transporter substrate-binding protein [Clostridium sp. DL1XJH146]
MKKKISVLMILLMITCFFTGCSDTEKFIKDDSIEKVIVTDCIGRNVEIPAEIDKVGCLYAVSGHVVTMLGDGEKIVAVNGGLQRDKVLCEMNPAILDAVVPKVSGDINIEELAKVKPDVVFVERGVDDNSKLSKMFKKFEIPYLVVDFNTIEEQQNMVSMIAQVLGKEEKAEKYNELYDELVAMVEDRVKDIKDEDKVTVYHSVNEATRTDAPDTLPVYWIEKAGAIDVSATEKLNLVDSAYYASLEQILMWNTDVILVNEDGVDEYILGQDQWKTLDAVKNNRVYKLPNGVSRWGHPTSIETPLAVVWTAKKLYPELFEDVNIEEITKNFYSEIFEYEIDDELVEKILIGKGMRDRKE